MQARLALAIAVLLLPAAAHAQLPDSPLEAPPLPTVAEGVSAGGVELGGLTGAQAVARLNARLHHHLYRDLVLRTGRRRTRLSMHRAGFKFDATKTAVRALGARPAGGGSVSVPLALTHSRKAVYAFVKRVARHVARRPRNARLHIGISRMRVKRAYYGRKLTPRRARVVISRALLGARGKRRVRVGLTRIRPAVRVQNLRRSYGTIITIQRGTFTLRLFKRLRVARRYSVAVGQPAYPTPTGMFHIQSKQVNPVWTAPHSPWAGELAGQSFSGGSINNPLKARWMGIAGGVGIHGTGEDWSIGSAASHGCIRMHVSDVIPLFNRTPVGTPVLIR